MTAEEQKKMQELEAENAALKERLLVAQRTLAKYAQMLFGQKTERCRLPEKPEELTGSLFGQEMDPAEQARLDREVEKALAEQDKLIHVEAHDRKVRKAIDTSRLEVKEELLYPDLDNKEDYTEMAPEVTDSRYKIDDNMVENSIRPLAIGQLSARISVQRFTHIILSIAHSRRSASRFSEWKRLNMVTAATKSAESSLMERGFGKNMSTPS